jgi:SanA protein
MTTGALVLLLFLAALSAASAGLSNWLRRSTRSRVVGSLAEPPPNVRIVVLGCRPQLRSGRPSRHLIGRVASAAAAYHHTPGRRILCTGFADEVAAMLTALERAAVPRSEIDVDAGARRTIDSIRFVAERHRNEKILLVTQPFHMPRTLFLARCHGIDAWGLIAAGPVPGWRSRLRERLAELRSIFDWLFG